MSNKTAESMNGRLVSCSHAARSSCCCAPDASLRVICLSLLPYFPARRAQRAEERSSFVVKSLVVKCVDLLMREL